MNTIKSLATLKSEASYLIALTEFTPLNESQEARLSELATLFKLIEAHVVEIEAPKKRIVDFILDQDTDEGDIDHSSEDIDQSVYTPKEEDADEGDACFAFLLNDGCFSGLENVNFPVEVEGMMRGSAFIVTKEELVRVGADPLLFTTNHTYTWTRDEWEQGTMIHLLDPDGFLGLYQVNFPVRVISTSICSDGNAKIPSTELVRIGAMKDSFSLPEYTWIKDSWSKAAPILLLNSNGFVGMDDMRFPVAVNALADGDELYVPGTELQRIGADSFDNMDFYTWNKPNWMAS